MGNLSNRPPLGLKIKAVAQDPEYLKAVRQLPCCICEAFGEVQRTRTEAHHVCHDRYSSRRTPDRMAIPLCVAHHTGTSLDDKLALHRAKDEWRAKYGPDHHYTAPTQDKLSHLLRDDAP